MTNTKVFKFGALPPGDGVRGQIRLANRYYNQLVEAENQRRRMAWGVADDAKAPPPPPHDDCDCAECAAHWTELRQRVRDAHLLDLKPLRAAARADGLYWGSYLKTEESFAAAWKKTKPTSLVRFRPWRRGGVVAVQIQPSANPDRIYRVRAAPDERTGRRRNSRRTLQIRIGSDGRDPIWSEPIPFTQHRETHGRVCWVLVCLRHVADREVWSVQFVCRDVPGRTDGATRGVVAIDVGWRRLLDGRTRIAYARGDDGEEYELALPEVWGELLPRADGVRAVRDRRVNDLKAADSRFGRVRSPRGVARVFHRDLGGDDEAVSAWLHRDRHLWQYEAGLRRRSPARRRNDTLVWLRMLRRRYRYVVIKDTKHKQMKEDAREDRSLHRPARRRGHRAAPGEVVEEIAKCFGRTDGVHVVAARYTTAQCHCGHIGEHGPELMLRCEGCGDDTDRDSVSTRNMLADYAEGRTRAPTARRTRARFASRHANSGEPSQGQLDAS